MPNAGKGLVVEGQLGEIGIVQDAGGGLVVEGQRCKFGVVQDAGDEVARGSDRDFVAFLWNSE